MKLIRDENISNLGPLRRFQSYDTIPIDFPDQGLRPMQTQNTPPPPHPRPDTKNLGFRVWTLNFFWPPFGRYVLHYCPPPPYGIKYQPFVAPFGTASASQHFKILPDNNNISIL